MSWLNNFLNKTSIDEKLLSEINKRRDAAGDWWESKYSFSGVGGDMLNAEPQKKSFLRDVILNPQPTTEPETPVGTEQPPVVEEIPPAPVDEMTEPQTESKFVWQTEDKQPFPKEWDEPVDQTAYKYGLRADVLASLLANESGHDWSGEPGDNGASRGIAQAQYSTYASVKNYYQEDIISHEEFNERMEDPLFAIDVAGEILRYKIDTVGGGDLFRGVAAYNGSGEQAIQYAKEVFERIGLPVPEEYR